MILIHAWIAFFSRQQHQLKDCWWRSFRIRRVEFHPRFSLFSSILPREALSWFHGNFQEELYSIFISPLLFLASYIWAVDAARCDGLEDLGKDDTSEGRFGKQPHAPCSVIFFSCIFFLSHTFPCHDRSLTVFLVKTTWFALTRLPNSRRLLCQWLRRTKLNIYQSFYFLIIFKLFWFYKIPFYYVMTIFTKLFHFWWLIG